jgi:glycine betaine/choline ABC-type transport system substrate-binding protein
MDRTQTFACLSLLWATLTTGCSHAPRITVGSKNFTEQVVLGEILAQQIERSLNIPVERRLNLGGTLLAHEALVKGEIDLYPEYTGTALTAILKQAPAAKASTAVFAEVAAAYRGQWRLDWLRPLGFNNTFAMMIRGETARGRRLASLSDAARAGAWRMGIGYEFQTRPDGLPGLLSAYGLNLEGQPLTMDLGLLYPALEGRKVDMIAANRTDGLASALDVTILEDDRHYFPPYDCAVVVREDTLAQFPGLRDAIERLSGKIGDGVMRKLNYAVDGQHRRAAEVAADFLKNVP